MELPGYFSCVHGVSELLNNGLFTVISWRPEPLFRQGVRATDSEIKAPTIPCNTNSTKSAN